MAIITTYTESLNNLDDREDKNFVINEGTTKPTGVHLRKREQGYMKEQRDVEKNHLAQQSSWLINNVNFCYDGDLPADKAGKEAIDMTGVTITRLPYTDYYLTISKTRNSKWQRELEYSSSSCRQYELMLIRLCIVHNRLTHGYLMKRNDQQPICPNVACRNQTLAIKHCFEKCPQ